MNEPNSKPFDEKTRRSVKNEIFSQSPWPSSSSREPKPLRNRRDAEGLVSHPPHVPLAESIVQWVLRMANQKTVQPRTGKYDACGAHPGPSSKESSKLRKSPGDRRASCDGFRSRSPSDCATHATTGHLRGRRTHISKDHRQRPQAFHCPQCSPTKLLRGVSGPSLSGRHQLHLDHGRMPLSLCDRRPFLKTSGRMVDG